MIENEINRDLAHRATEAELHETATVSAFEGAPCELRVGSIEKQSKSGFGDEIEKSDDEELNDQESADIIEN